jgi:opacity protein-like surface antigen
MQAIRARGMALMAGVLLTSGAASAQTAAAVPSSTETKGYLEVVAQSAFGNVTSQSYGVEGGVNLTPALQVYVEAGQTSNVATAAISSAAQTIAGGMSQTVTGVSYAVKEPATFGVVGLRYNFAIEGRKVTPYVLAGGGVARLQKNVTFAVNGADVTSNLQQYDVVLGTDLSGTSTSAMLSIGAGIARPVWHQLMFDAQFRYGRIFAPGQGINLTRVGVGIGVRF